MIDTFVGTLDELQAFEITPALRNVRIVDNKSKFIANKRLEKLQYGLSTLEIYSASITEIKVDTKALKFFKGLSTIRIVAPIERFTEDFCIKCNSLRTFEIDNGGRTGFVVEKQFFNDCVSLTNVNIVSGPITFDLRCEAFKSASRSSAWR